MRLLNKQWKKVVGRQTHTGYTMRHKDRNIGSIAERLRHRKKDTKKKKLKKIVFQ